MYHNFKKMVKVQYFYEWFKLKFKQFIRLKNITSVTKKTSVLIMHDCVLRKLYMNAFELKCVNPDDILYVC